MTGCLQPGKAGKSGKGEREKANMDNRREKLSQMHVAGWGALPFLKLWEMGFPSNSTKITQGVE